MVTLRMKFLMSNGKNHIVSLNYAKPTVTAAQVTTAMNAFITNSVLVKDVTAVSGADLVERTVTTVIA